MPRKTQVEDAESRALNQVMAEDEDVLNRLALESGPPPDSERLSEADEDRLYAQVDPIVHGDPEGFARRLLTQGLDQQMLQQLQVLKGFPEWAQIYAQPTQSIELADQLTKLARWPYRPAMLADFADPEDMVRTGEALDRRYQRKHASSTEPITLGTPPTEGG